MIRPFYDYEVMNNLIGYGIVNDMKVVISLIKNQFCFFVLEDNMYFTVDLKKYLKKMTPKDIETVTKTFINGCYIHKNSKSISSFVDTNITSEDSKRFLFDLYYKSNYLFDKNNNLFCIKGSNNNIKYEIKYFILTPLKE